VSHHSSAARFSERAVNQTHGWLADRPSTAGLWLDTSWRRPCQIHPPVPVGVPSHSSLR